MADAVERTYKFGVFEILALARAAREILATCGPFSNPDFRHLHTPDWYVCVRGTRRRARGSCPRIKYTPDIYIYNYIDL